MKEPIKFSQIITKRVNIMNTHTFSNGGLIAKMVIVAIFMNSCGTPAYKKTIPSDAVAVVELDVKSIGKKADFFEQKEKIADLITSTNPEDRMMRKIADVVNNPMNTGLNMMKPVYFFALPSVEDAFVLASVKDKSAFTNTLTSISKDFEVSTSGDISWIMVDEQIYGALTEDALLISVTGLKDRSVYRELLDQNKPQHFFTKSNSELMRRYKGEITAMVNIRSLSKNIKRDIRREIENDFGMYDTEDIWNQLFETQLIVNLQCKSGYMALNLFANGLGDLSSNPLVKTIDPDELKQLPNTNIVGVAAMGVEGEVYWKIVHAVMYPLVRKMSYEERDAYDAVGELVRSIDGTLVGSIGGKDIIRNPEVLCILPTSKSNVKNTINALGGQLPDDLYLDGNNTHAAVSNMYHYDFGSHISSFDKASNAKASYLYVYAKAEPLVNELFDEIYRGAEREDVKVWNKFRDMCEQVDYAELKVEKKSKKLLGVLTGIYEEIAFDADGKNKISLTMYMNDASENVLSIILKNGIKIGDAIVDYENYRRERERRNNSYNSPVYEEVDVAYAEEVVGEY